MTHLQIASTKGQRWNDFKLFSKLPGLCTHLQKRRFICQKALCPSARTLSKPCRDAGVRLTWLCLPSVLSWRQLSLSVIHGCLQRTFSSILVSPCFYPIILAPKLGLAGHSRITCLLKEITELLFSSQAPGDHQRAFFFLSYMPIRCLLFFHLNLLSEPSFCCPDID